MATTYPQSRTGNGLAIAALVCGLVGAVLFNVVLGPLAIIVGGVAWSKADHGAPHRGMAVAGVILGIVDLAIFGVVLGLASSHGGYWHVG